MTKLNSRPARTKVTAVHGVHIRRMLVPFYTLRSPHTPMKYGDVFQDVPDRSHVCCFDPRCCNDIVHNTAASVALLRCFVLRWVY